MERIAALLVVLATLRGTCAVSASDKQTILNKHNEFRGAANPTAVFMLKLRWNDKLEKSVQDFIDNCPAGKQGSVEREAAADIGVSVGQNMVTGKNNWIDAITYWHNQIANFTYTQGGRPTDETVEDFTQMMLSRSSHVGCGYKECPGAAFSNIYACNYAFQQTAEDVKEPWTRGPPCSECGGFCRRNLCDCGNEICLNGGILNTTECTCVCPTLYEGSTLCDEVNCVADEPSCRVEEPYGFKDKCHLSTVPPLCPHMCGYC